MIQMAEKSHIKTRPSDTSFAELMRQEDVSPTCKTKQHQASPTATVPYTEKIPIPSRIEPSQAEYRKAGLQIKEFTRLKRGKIPSGDKIDLHAHTIQQACDALENFIATAQMRNIRNVLIICGKGTRSKDGIAVLRDFSRLFLKEHSQVIAYCCAMPQHGGDGAIQALLKTREGKRS